MLPEVEKYFELKDKVTDEQISGKMAEIIATYSAKEGGWNDDNRYAFTSEVENVASKIRRENQDAAVKILEGSEDKFIAYMAKDWLGSYPSHIETILKALPATVEDLDVISSTNNWCSEYERFIEAAIEAGVIAARRPLTKAEKELDTWVRRNWSSNKLTRQTLVNLARAVAEEAVAAAAGTDEKSADEMIVTA